MAFFLLYFKERGVSRGRRNEMIPYGIGLRFQLSMPAFLFGTPDIFTPLIYGCYTVGFRLVAEVSPRCFERVYI